MCQVPVCIAVDTRSRVTPTCSHPHVSASVPELCDTPDKTPLPTRWCLMAPEMLQDLLAGLWLLLAEITCTL